ncbi:MAG: hypothetical protein JWN95_2510 [Frankiales bacterium]|nr:hypothetical protein [Frankiales bacterium]
MRFMVVEWPGSWTPVDESWLCRLAANAAENGGTGFDPGDMPDSAWVLHALYESISGNTAFDEEQPEEDGIVWFHDPGPGFRRVRWAEVVRRSGGPLVLPGRWPGVSVALPSLVRDTQAWDLVYGPCEGSVDLESWQRLMQLLSQMSGPDIMCTAYYVQWASFPEPGQPEPPSLFRGRLDDVQALTRNPSWKWSPQNVWPDDHSWVVYTDYDLWATRVSGSTAMLEQLSEDSFLEIARLPHVPAPKLPPRL